MKRLKQNSWDIKLFQKIISENYFRNKLLEYVIDTQNCCGDISPNAKETNIECAESQRY